MICHLFIQLILTRKAFELISICLGSCASSSINCTSCCLFCSVGIDEGPIPGIFLFFLLSLLPVFLSLPPTRLRILLLSPLLLSFPLLFPAPLLFPPSSLLQSLLSSLLFSSPSLPSTPILLSLLFHFHSPG